MSWRPSDEFAANDNEEFLDVGRLENDNRALRTILARILDLPFTKVQAEPFACICECESCKTIVTLQEARLVLEGTTPRKEQVVA